jgi:rhodanese-related sulfurtransferase
MQNINQEKFIELSESGKYTILDVRQPNECASGIVSGAKEIDFMDQSLFMSEVEKLNKNDNYLVYCRSGNRSGMACRMMDNIGFKNTYNLTGGMLAWTGPLEN